MIEGCKNIVAGIILFITAILSAGICFIAHSATPGFFFFLMGLAVALSPRMVLEWEKGVLLRLGRFNRVIEPGITWIVPGIDAISSIVDMRVRTTDFSAEKALTRDTVPVDVDAVLFWVIFDAKRAILEVEDYENTINWVAQTSLRDIIGRSELGKLISDREGLDEELQNILDHKTNEWGITVQSVEIRDVKIPTSLEDAMSRKAQAEREKEARIILSESEEGVALEMQKAAALYQNNDAALQLRMMNMTYESVKEKGALMVIPSNMSESLSGQTMGIASAGFKLHPPKEPNDELF